MVVDGAQFLGRVPPAQIAEGRIFFDLIGVLGIKHQHIHAECGRPVKEAADRLYRHHTAARHIQHRTAQVKNGMLLHRKGRPALFRFHRKDRLCPHFLRHRGIADFGILAVVAYQNAIELCFPDSHTFSPSGGRRSGGMLYFSL